MQLKELIGKLDLEVIADCGGLDSTVKRGYASDLLSEVMANAPEGGVWITVQVHENVVAVGVLRSLAAIVFAAGRKPVEKTLERARAQGVTLLGSKASAFELAGRMFELGIGD